MITVSETQWLVLKENLLRLIKDPNAVDLLIKLDHNSLEKLASLCTIALQEKDGVKRSDFRIR